MLQLSPIRGILFFETRPLPCCVCSRARIPVACPPVNRFSKRSSQGRNKLGDNPSCTAWAQNSSRQRHCRPPSTPLSHPHPQAGCGARAALITLESRENLQVYCAVPVTQGVRRQELRAGAPPGHPAKAHFDHQTSCLTRHTSLDSISLPPLIYAATLHIMHLLGFKIPHYAQSTL